MEKVRCPRLLAVAFAVAGPVAADVVHLNNGRKFEGVIAEVGAERVLVRFEFGDLAVPRRLVARVEKGSSALLEFEARRTTLAGRPEARAEDWLELARWALAAGLEHAAAQAALTAVQLDPELAGAAALLGQLGYLQDETSGQWLRYEEAMSRKGYIQFRGSWMPGSEAAAILDAEAREAAERAVAQREDRLTEVVELLALAELAEASRPPQIGVPVYSYPVVAIPGFFPHFHRKKPLVPPSPQARDVLDDLLHRNPGSLLPVGDPLSRIRTRFSSH